MNVLNPYLAFDGNCEDALKFYANALGGSILSLQRFGDVPNNGGADESRKNKVMHSEFEFAGNKFMASDSMPHFQMIVGNNVTMCIALDSEQRATEYFVHLSDGGNVQMPLQDTFWGAKFGMLTDKFGINWMINCEKPQ